MTTPHYLTVRHWNLLNVLSGGERTSHDIRDRYAQFSQGSSISYGSVYIHMGRLCDKGLVEFREVKEVDRKRRLFQLTDLGQQTLCEAPWIRHW